MAVSWFSIRLFVVGRYPPKRRQRASFNGAIKKLFDLAYVIRIISVSWADSEGQRVFRA